MNTSTLTAIYDFSDLDSDSENTGLRELRWYKNGVLESIYNNLLILPNTATTKGETWNYRIRVNDGLDYSNWINSTSVTISNSAPTASDIKIINQVPGTNDDLVASWIFSDIDMDTENPNWIINWYKNDILQGALNNSKTVLSGNTTKTDIWYFKLQVYDGSNYSILYQSSSVQILNTAPTASSINITQNPTTIDQLVASWAFNDVDGDSPSAIVNITWYQDGVYQATYDNSTTIDSSATSKGEIWHYILQVYDAEDFSAAYNSSDSGAFATILNTSPSASNLGITTNPSTTENLVANWDYTDIDGDSENTSWIIHWYKDASLQSAYENLTIILSSATAKGEVWNYTLQVYDGENYSITYSSSSTTIINSAPTASGLSLPANPTTTINLIADWIYFDSDSDAEDPNWIILWYKNGLIEPSLNNTKTVLAGNTTKNQVWYFTIQVYDGEDYSTLYTSSSVSIQNTAPTASNYQVTANPTTSDNLLATWAYSDIDGDTQSSSWLILWYQNGFLQPALNDSTTVSYALTSKSEDWHFSLQVFDGVDYSVLYTSVNVTILNSAPTASNLAITPTPTTSNDLVASWDYTDSDSDPENNSWIITWYSDGNLESAYTNLTTVSSSATSKGEVWNYTLQVFDGENYSSVYTSPSTTIINSLPTVTNPTFNKTSGVTTTNDVEIIYLASYFDADGDPNNVSMLIVYWFDTGIYNSTKDNQTILYSSDTATGDFWYYILKVFDGTDYSQNITSPGLGIGSVPNDAPFAENLTLTTNPTTNDNLLASYDYSDNQSHLEAGSEIRWYQNGVLQPEFNDTTTLPFTATAKGENWHFTIKPKDGLEFGTLRTSANITILNTAPSASNLDLSSSPKTNDDLEASWDYTDTDGDSQNTSWIIHWYKDGVLQSSYDNLTSVSSSETNKGEVWNYTLQVYDGENYSIVYSSSSTTILNTAPTATGLTLTANPATTDNLVANWTYADTDSDPENSTWVVLWYKNTVLQSALNGTKTVIAGNTTKNQVWYFTVQVYDGTNYSLLYTSSSVQIQNTAPTASNYQVTTSPTTSDTLVASWTYSDIDGDTESTNWLILWYQDGILQPASNDSTTVSSSLTSKYENWHFSLQVFDGVDYSVLYTSANVTILNSAPTASNLGITINPTTSHDLVANWDYTDVDGDTQNASWIIHWYKDGNLQSAYGNLTTVASSATSKGEVWNFILQAFDGEDYSITYNSSMLGVFATIRNSAPTATNLRFTNPVPQTVDTLVANWTFSDNDNDLEDPGWLISWYKSNVIQGNLNNSRTVTSGNTSKNQVWYFTLQVYDGINYSILYQSPNFQILNTAPTTSNLDITLSPTTSDDLEPSWSFNDADGDSPSIIVNITWYKDGIQQIPYNNQTTIPSSATSKGEIWHYLLQVHDGESFSILYNSSESGVIALILNTIPVATNVKITDSSPYTINDLVGDWIYSDTDGDSQSATRNLTWYKNGLHESSYDNATTLPASATVKGEQWNFILQVYDGESFSIAYNSSAVTIINSIPTLSSIPTFNKTTGVKTTDDLEISYVYQDDDNDTIVLANVIVKWFLYGFEQPTKENQTILNDFDTDKGQFWSYQIQIFDGESYSIVYNSVLILIENSAPVVQGTLNITPSSPAPGNTLILSYTWVDDDPGDIEIDTEIRWYKNDVLQSAFNGFLSIDGNYIIKNDLWNVTIRPKDGTDFGVLTFISVFIGNTKPEIRTNGLGASTVYTTTDLYVNTSFSELLIFYDSDADPIVWIEYRWFLNNVENSTYYNQSVIPSNETMKGEQWRFTLQISDGETVSDIFNSITVEIQNSIPVVSNVLISPGYITLYTNNSLDLSWNYTDADLDSEIVSQMKVTWYLNGLEQFGLANSTSVPSSMVRKNDIWTVQIQVFDGTNFSTVQSFGPVIIQNTPGIVNNVYLNNNAGTTNVTTSLILSWNFIDADGDGESNLNITWYKSTNNGSTWLHQTNWDNQTSIDAVNLIKEEFWSVKINIFDGDEWSIMQNSQTIIIINSIPKIDSFNFINTEYQQFIVEDEAIQISYSFYDADATDIDESIIFWFINGVHDSSYDNLTIIPSSETIVGQVWTAQIIPNDGYDTGIILSSENKTIEDRPDILDYGVVSINTTSEGHFILWFDVRTNAVNPLIPLPTINIDLVVNSTDPISVTANSNGTHYVYEWRYIDYSKIGSKVEVSVVATSSVSYDGVTSIIPKSLIFEFIMLDTAPPRVKDVDLIFDNEENPTSIEFFVRIEEYGSGVDNATLYYAFVPPTDQKETSAPTSINPLHFRIMQSGILREDFSSVPLTPLNSTHYGVTIDFNQNATVLILYQIQIFDKSGNSNPNAYPEGLDESKALRYNPPVVGIPLEEVFAFIAIIIFAMLIFSFVIIKKFRSKELVGLDIDLVIENISNLKIKEEQLVKELDNYTLGVVVSFFDQRHGPVPVLYEPSMLRDNFEKLIELSDLSFSTGRFVEKFDIEEQNTFTFRIDEDTRITSLSYSFSLDRPNARGGAENLNANILIFKEVFPLISQFTTHIRPIIRRIHQTLESDPNSKDTVLKDLFEIRKLITQIALSHIDLYGTIEIESNEFLENYEGEIN
ncbi:MAG: hypothetical protein ACXAC2_01615 [Candidatus Kariarchaeaceae archaeon]